jgi:hypothetical protein
MNLSSKLVISDANKIYVLLILGILDDDQLIIPGLIDKSWSEDPCTDILRQIKLVGSATNLCHWINILDMPPFISSGTSWKTEMIHPIVACHC